MSEEPRRSGRATKGQHKYASPSPAPTAKPAKATKGKRSKKTDDPAPAEDDDDDGDDEEVIRCVCGNSDPNDSKTFISCDACSVWQHSVCMGLPVDEDDMPAHYFCEECRPSEHTELLQALERGEKLWETRMKIFEAETKANKGRKGKAKQADSKPPGWLRKEVAPEEDEQAEEEESKVTPSTESVPHTSNKRKRVSTVDDPADSPAPTSEKSQRASRQDKRRKPSAEPKLEPDADTALVAIASLPADRQKIAQVLADIITKGIEERIKSGHKLPRGQSAQAAGEHYAIRIEYELFQNHGGPKESAYAQQCRALNANLKKNKELIERLLDGSLTPSELSTMSTSDMASDALQRERAVMKEALDRQAVAVAEEGPRYRQDHKGYQLIEDDNQHLKHDNVLQSTGIHAREGDEADVKPAIVRSPSQGEAAAENGENESANRRASNQNFDMTNIWAKTAQSPTVSGPADHARRPSQPQPSRQNTANGAKDDPDIDRLLDDNDDYTPADASGPDAIVWRGKLSQSGDDAPPTVNARFVAGRDLSTTIPWQSLFPSKLSIDGRLQTAKAEEYLCGLRWSTSSDVSVLALTPHDDAAAAFNTVFDYFHSRQRYAVVAAGKPALVKDLYIIPIEVGADLPDHVEMLEHCTIKKPIEERLMLISLVVARSPDSPAQQDSATPAAASRVPQHVRQSISGPAGSPITAQNPYFLPATPSNAQTSATPNPSNATASPSQADPPYGQAPPAQGHGAFPPNPYSPHPPQQQSGYAQPPAQQMQLPHHSNPQIDKILGDLQYAPTAQELLRAGRTLTEVELSNLRRVLDHHPAARTDMATFARLLGT